MESSQNSAPNDSKDNACVRGYAPAGSVRSLCLLIAMIAFVGGGVVAFKNESPERWQGLAVSVAGLLGFALGAGSVDRITIDTRRATYERRKGIAGWFRPPEKGQLAETKGVGLGRRKMGRSSSISWAPLIVWADGQVHVLSMGNRHDFRQAGVDVRRIEALPGVALLQEHVQEADEWNVVPLELADREVHDPAQVLAKKLRGGRENDSR